MKWFGWKPGRAEARPALARGGGGTGAPFALAPQGYEAQVRSGYLANPVAQRAVRLVAEAVGAAPFDAAEDVRALVRPALLNAAAAQLLLHGNAFVQVLRGADGVPVELYPLRPERVAVEPDAAGWPAAYLYRVGTKAARLGCEEVIHLRAFHPLDDQLGLSCLPAASAAIAVHNAATAWAKGLLDNAARPSGALVYDPGDGSAMSAEQFRRLREEMEAGFAGAANAGRPMLLEGGLKWQALSLSPADLDFAETKAAAAREIALAFGVPPMLLGLPGDSTHANYKEANRALWRLTVLPMAEGMLGDLGRGLAAWVAEPAMTLDPDRVPALVEDRERLWRMVSAATFISDGEKRQMTGWAK